MAQCQGSNVYCIKTHACLLNVYSVYAIKQDTLKYPSVLRTNDFNLFYLSCYGPLFQQPLACPTSTGHVSGLQEIILKCWQTTQTCSLHPIMHHINTIYSLSNCVCLNVQMLCKGAHTVYVHTFFSQPALLYTLLPAIKTVGVG